MNEKNMTFLEHLEELRWHIIRSLLAIVVFAIAAFAFRGIVFDKVLLGPRSAEFFTNRKLCELGKKLDMTETLCINAEKLQIINVKMAGQFSTHITVSFVAGIIFAFPFIFAEFWRFLKPALYPNEKRHARGAVFFSSFLFMLGVLFGYYLIAPLSIQFLGTYMVSSDVSNQIHLGSYIGTVTSVVLASGVIFELPILIYFLSKVGLVGPAFLKKYRKHAVVIILIVAAIITPPDIISQILVSLPLMLLYEVGILISKRMERRNEAKEKLVLKKA